MRSTKIAMASAVIRLAAMRSGASPRTSLPTMVAQTKPPKELLNDRERENKWVDRSVAAFWPSVFTFFMEGFAAYGAMMHGISVDAVLTATRCSSSWSAGRTTFEAAHEHGPHLKSEHSDAVEFDRAATTPIGRAEIG
jgi:hypothetical protein